MREEYEKNARQKRELDLENLVRSKAEFQLTMDATQVFDPYEPPVFVGFGQTAAPKKKGPLHAISKAQVQQLFMRSSFEVREKKRKEFYCTKLFFYTKRLKLDPRLMQLLVGQWYPDPVWEEEMSWALFVIQSLLNYGVK